MAELGRVNVNPSMRTRFGRQPDRRLHRNDQVRGYFRLCSVKFSEARGGSRLPNSAQTHTRGGMIGAYQQERSNALSIAARGQRAAVGVDTRLQRRLAQVRRLRRRPDAPERLEVPSRSCTSSPMPKTRPASSPPSVTPSRPAAFWPCPMGPPTSTRPRSPALRQPPTTAPPPPWSCAPARRSSVSWSASSPRSPASSRFPCGCQTPGPGRRTWRRSACTRPSPRGTDRLPGQLSNFGPNGPWLRLACKEFPRCRAGRPPTASPVCRQTGQVIVSVVITLTPRCSPRRSRRHRRDLTSLTDSGTAVWRTRRE